MAAINNVRRLFTPFDPCEYEALVSFDPTMNLTDDRQTCSNPATFTVSVIGLSGSDALKNDAGVGKSALCNRLVRPGFEDFTSHHISHLSQADFSGSPVINSDHWLYWGEAFVEPETNGARAAFISVIEQTEFLDDETFAPIRSSRQTADYIKRATRVDLESPDKIMYVCRDQLGNESEFKTQSLADGRAHVDAFVLVYDVSRAVPKQSEFAVSLIQAVAKAKRPVFLVASKCDSKRYIDGLNDLQRLLRRKECKNVNPQIFETSAECNINIQPLLRFIVATLEKVKTKPRVAPYSEEFKLQTVKLQDTRQNYGLLISQLLPREEWPVLQNHSNWKSLLNSLGLRFQPAYIAFVDAFGRRAAEKIYDEHMRESREWWMAKEQREKLPSLRNVLLEFFDSSKLVKSQWDDIVYDTERHPMFDRYFKPVGQSLDRYTHRTQDDRVPAELLRTVEAQQMFSTLQKEIGDKALLEAQMKRFISFLAVKEAIMPGRSYSDAKTYVHEINTFERILPAGRAEQAYNDFQAVIIEDAERNFQELLLERVPVFAAYAMFKQDKGVSPRSIAENERYFTESLQDDRRFRVLDSLEEKRRRIIQKYTNFVCNPLDDNCPSTSFCANKQIPKIIENHRSRSPHVKYTPVDIVIYGEDYLVEEFMYAVNNVIPSDRVYDYDSGLAKISCYKASTSYNLARVRSPICIVKSMKSVQSFLDRKGVLGHGMPPLLITCENDIFLRKQVATVADKIGGICISEEHLDVDDTVFHVLTEHFSLEQIHRVLNKICHDQCCGSYSDLRIQFSFMCGEVLKPDVVLGMLLDNANHSTSGCNTFTFDHHLPHEDLDIRIRVDAVAYHSWLLSPSGWAMNSINGHVLVYSPLRIASWHYAEMAARMLVEAAGTNPDDRLAVGKSIFILAVDDPSNYFNNKNSQYLLTLGNKLAEEIGATFSTLSPNTSGPSQAQLFADFFELIFNNDAMPESFYYPSMLSTNTLTQITGGSSTSSDDGPTREFTTLKSTGSLTSHDSNDSGTSAVSTNGDFYSAARGIATKQGVAGAPGVPAPGFGRSASPSYLPSNGIKSPTHVISQLSMHSSNSGTTSEASTAPLARPESVEINNEFIYQKVTPSQTSYLTGSSESSCKSQRKMDKLLPRLARLNLDTNTPSGTTNVIVDNDADAQAVPSSDVVQMFVNGACYLRGQYPSSDLNVTNIVIPTIERPASQIRFRVNGTDKSVDEDGNVIAANRFGHLRSHSSESIFLDPDDSATSADSPPAPTKGIRNRRIAQRQGSLRDTRDRRNRSCSRGPSGKRSLLSAANETANRAQKFVASLRHKSRSSPNTEDCVEIVKVVRLDSFGNSPGRMVPPSSISMPMSPNMVKKSGLSKTSSAVSNAFSWLPNRSQKRSQRGKSEGAMMSSSPSPVETLQSLCDSVNTVDGLPLFVVKCINYLEQNGGLETEGIYRVPGNQSQVAELEAALRANPDLDLSVLSMPVHVVATAIKKFFDNLPEPIIPVTLHSTVTQIVEDICDFAHSPNSPSTTPSDTTSGYKALTQNHIDSLSTVFREQLPTVNKNVLGFLTAHLSLVAKNIEKTSMDLRNLAIIFSPTLFRPGFNNFNEMYSQIAKFEIATFVMLHNYDNIFNQESTV
uniref:Rho GTPase-activating protein n=1 Tax=Panagrellus redivivus TaxID=6233 RepID=A0A7E5A0H6_PANRE